MSLKDLRSDLLHVIAGYGRRGQLWIDDFYHIFKQPRCNGPSRMLGVGEDRMCSKVLASSEPWVSEAWEAHCVFQAQKLPITSTDRL